MLDYSLAKLDNGLRVITAPLENTKAVSLFVLVGTGSRFENKENNGIAHFLEHMFFKGTEKRPKTVDIARELDAVGASFNAFTGEEYTGFYIRAEQSHFDLALDVLSDMLFHSKFDANEIEKEKGVILEEINMIRDVPQSYIEYVMKDLLYGDSPLGRMITGEPAGVKAFSRETFTDFKAAQYKAENMIVVVAGGSSTASNEVKLGVNSSEEIWLEKITKVFNQMPAEKPADFEKISESQSAAQIKIYPKKTDQAHFILGFRSLKRTDPRRPILKVLNNLMGGTMSSRLFIEVREKRGLCYYVSSDIIEYHETGFWGVSAGVDIKRVEEAIEVIIAEFARLKSELVTDEELSRAKENMKGHLYLGLEESLSVAEFLAEQALLWQKIDDPDQIVAEMQKVTREEVQKLAQEFTPDKLNLAIIGPFEGEEEKENFEAILKKYN